tara:strand:- start:256 stop:642 length:387 start_codon:yes stop_codon:yes gene_type:complete
MLTVQDIHVLGQILNTTYGKSSTLSPVASVKCQLYGSEPTKLSVDYTSVVTFASEASMREQKKAFENESNQATNNKMKEIKKEFKDAAGRALKAKQLKSEDSIEVINASPHTPRKTAYYRRKTLFEVG